MAEDKTIYELDQLSSPQDDDKIPIYDDSSAVTSYIKYSDLFKAIKDSGLTIQDNVDPTKQAQFQASGITAGQTRVYTLPDGSTTLVGTGLTQTLTNKTLTSPVINTPTGVVKGDVGLGNVDNTSDATKNSASVTLTNKTLTTPTIASFVNANHDHSNSAGGGQLGDSAFPSALSPVTRLQETIFDHVASGCVLAGVSYGSTLNFSLSSGVVYINGLRVPVAAISSQALTASRDAYIDVDSAGTVSVSYSTNNAASQALAANSIRLGIIVTGAGSIASVASVNQGQETKVLPIASSIPYQVTDSLGNLICPRDPQRKVLGYRQITSTFVTVGTSETAIPGLSVPVIVPTGRKVKIRMWSRGVEWGNSNVTTRLYDGAIGGTKIAEGYHNAAASAGIANVDVVECVMTPSTSSKTFNGAIISSATSANFSATSLTPAFIIVELA